MSIDLVVVVAAAIVALALIEKAPAIVSAIADLRVAGDRDLTGLVSETEAESAVALCVVAAIRRSDPDLNDELVERLADTVLEDFARGTLGMTETLDPRGDVGPS